MNENDEKISFLSKRLEELSVQQENISMEIKFIRNEVNSIKLDEKFDKNVAKDEIKSVIPEFKKVDTLTNKPVVTFTPQKTETKKSNIEKYIGENLIGRIGIIITVIGVAIGVKYAIDYKIITPLMRIIFGYLFGIGLMIFAFRLKAKYENFSAVLLSGSMAIMYFITYIANDFYDFIPQIPAFILMVLFTAFTVFTSITFNKQIIACLGLVGAYAVPFLLSKGSEQSVILLSYILVINIGILFISFKKYWKSLYYLSFVFTWLIFTTWYQFKHNSLSINSAFLFATLYFIVFYTTFLSYKLLQKIKYNSGDIILLISNSFIFYGYCYVMIDDFPNGEKFTGLVTLVNAFIHGVAAFIVLKQKDSDKNLLRFISGLALVFITIAIPVQLDGSWVTLLWAGEAVILYRIGCSKENSFYEKMSFPLMLFAFIAMIINWNGMYDNNTIPIFNIGFMTSILFSIAFGYMIFINQKLYFFTKNELSSFSKIVLFIITSIFLISLFHAFYAEISNYLKIISVNLKIKQIWLLNYSMLYFILLSYINQKFTKNIRLAFFNTLINTGLILLFLTFGLYNLSEIRESYLQQVDYYDKEIFHIAIRYVSILLTSGLLFFTHRYIFVQNFKSANLKIAFELFIHLTAIWVISSELFHWMDISGFTQSHKLGLSVLWGIYSLFLIAIGIWKKKYYLRISGITFFGVTLVKLFIYDISHLDNISKTIVFVSLGILLLIASFLYNKHLRIEN